MSRPRELTVIAEQLLAPVPGGTGRYTAELLRALAATAPVGWEVSSVVAWRRDVAPARIDGVRGPRVLPLPRRALTAAWQAGVPFWPGGDSVHAPTPLAPPRAPGGRRLTVTAHDTVPWTHPETLTPRGAGWHRTVLARAARGADALIVPTQAVADELAEYLPGMRARVIGHGVTDRLVVGEAGPPELPERFVLAVGTVEPRKGIDVLIDAVSKLDDVSLVLVGQAGWGGLDPLELARGHGLTPDRLRVLGRLGDGELAWVLRRASVLAAPSMAEGFGLPVLEAMSAGVPVVHSDAAALVEVGGGAGRVVPRGDARALADELGRVLGSAELAVELADAGRTRAAQYSWHAAACQLWALHV